MSPTPTRLAKRLPLLAAVLVAAACPTRTLAADPLSELKLAPVPLKPWVFKGFPILAWWPPPGTATLQDFKNYQEAGFTLYCANPDAGFESSLQLARQAGLPVIAWRTRQGFSTPAPKQPVLFPTTDTNIVGWIVCDEPSGLAPVTAAITDANRLLLLGADRLGRVVGQEGHRRSRHRRQNRLV